MTEAKSPREIAEDTPRGKALGIVHWYGRIQQTPRAPYAQELADAIEQALLSYAAERERLLAEADAAVIWDIEGKDCRYTYAELNRFELEAIARHRLRSRPATEGKGDD